MEALPTTEFRALPGKGVTDSVAGTRLIAGKPGLMTKDGIQIPEEPDVSGRGDRTESVTGGKE